MALLNMIPLLKNIIIVVTLVDDGLSVFYGANFLKPKGKKCSRICFVCCSRKKIQKTQNFESNEALTNRLFRSERSLFWFFVVA